MEARSGFRCRVSEPDNVRSVVFSPSVVSFLVGPQSLWVAAHFFLFMKVIAIKQGRPMGDLKWITPGEVLEVSREAARFLEATGWVKLESSPIETPKRRPYKRRETK